MRKLLLMVHQYGGNDVTSKLRISNSFLLSLLSAFLGVSWSLKSNLIYHFFHSRNIIDRTNSGLETNFSA